MKVAVIFDNLGPYHIARLSAAAECCDLHVIEEWGISSDHSWGSRSQARKFTQTTLFPNSATRSTPRSDLGQAVLQSLDRLKPDVVAIPGWSDAGAVAALRWCCRNRVPSVLMSTSSRLQERGSKLKEVIKKRIVPLYSAGFCGGTPHRDYLVSLGMSPDRIFLGYNAVDNAHFATGAEAARKNESALRTKHALPNDYFLGSWRFIPEKNIPALLQAYTQYVTDAGQAAWKFVMLGDGPLLPEILRLQADLGLQKQLLMPGFVQYDHLPVYYALARAFVLASVSETWGLVINEAMASSLPVAVSTACGCHLDLIQSDLNGWTFDPRDEASLVGIFKTLAANHPRLAIMGAEGRKIIGDWSLDRFGSGFRQACVAAIESGAVQAGHAERLLLSLV
jgi:glycosyltransferase involved in cell wall biosynthesis